jgi:protein TonB
VTLADGDAQERRRWSGALGLALVIHLAPAVIAAWWLGPMPPLVPPEPALLIDMAPPAAPPTPPSEQTPGPRQMQSEAPRPVVKQIAPPVAAARDPEVALPERQAPVRPATEAAPAPRTSAPPSRPAAVERAASSGTADWRGQVLARLDAVKRYPAAAEIRRQQGVPYIRIIMDRQGRVLNTRLERGSGVAALDKEAVALPGRAQPLPRPPEDVPGNPLELVAPVEFYLAR